MYTPSVVCIMVYIMKGAFFTHRLSLMSIGVKKAPFAATIGDENEITMKWYVKCLVILQKRTAVFFNALIIPGMYALSSIVSITSVTSIQSI